MLATFSVENVSDGPAPTPTFDMSGNHVLVGTLRQMIVNANDNPGPDTIVFNLPAGSNTITLTQGELLITDVVTINGPGWDELTISGGGASRVMRIAGQFGAERVEVHDLTIANGLVSDVGAGTWATGNFLLDTVRIEDNHSTTGSGGGVFADGFGTDLAHAEIVNSIFTLNTAGSENPFAVGQGDTSAGGGLFIDAGPGDAVVVRDSVFSSNSALNGLANPADGLGTGGGIFVIAGDSGAVASVVMEGLLIENNTALGRAGGVSIEAIEGSFTALRNSVVRGNSAFAEDTEFGAFHRGEGGGIAVGTSGGEVLLDGLSVYTNTAGFPRVLGGEERRQTSGGGIHVTTGDGIAVPPGKLVEIVNTTIDSNIANIGGVLALDDADSVSRTIVRHSTITSNLAGEAGDQQSPAREERGDSNGGGISLGNFFKLAPDPAVGATTDYDGSLFLDHTVVRNNAHLPRLAAFDFESLGLDEIGLFDDDATRIGTSPDIGVNGLYRFYKVNPFDFESLVPHDTGPFAAPYGGLTVSYSDLGSYPLFELANVTTINGVTVAGGLTEKTLLDDAVYWNPAGGLVDAGDPAYDNADPQYWLPSAAGILGGGAIDTDQRDVPFDRVANDRIDIGAIELQGVVEGPRVTNVLVDSRVSSSPVYDYDDVIDTERAGGGRTGIQVDTATVLAADRITIRFDRPIDVTAAADALTITGTRLANVPTPTLDSWSVDRQELVWNVDGWGESDRYAIRLSEDAIRDDTGAALDGDWVNPLNRDVTNPDVDVFPSGDGAAGGDFVFLMSLLFGDSEPDSDVDIIDFGLFADAFDSVFGDSNYDERFDFELDDDIDIIDFGKFADGFGIDLRNDVLLLADLDADAVGGNPNIIDSMDEMLLETRGDFDGDGVVEQNERDFFFGWLGFRGVA